jgi:hypothetical protein
LPILVRMFSTCLIAAPDHLLIGRIVGIDDQGAVGVVVLLGRRGTHATAPAVPATAVAAVAEVSGCVAGPILGREVVGDVNVRILLDLGEAALAQLLLDHTSDAVRHHLIALDVAFRGVDVLEGLDAVEVIVVGVIDLHLLRHRRRRDQGHNKYNSECFLHLSAPFEGPFYRPGSYETKKPGPNNSTPARRLETQSPGRQRDDRALNSHLFDESTYPCPRGSCPTSCRSW